MKNTLLFLALICITSLHCRSQSESKKKSKSKTASSVSTTQQNAATYLVSGKIMQIRPYCGGARPSEEMIQRANTPQPYPNKKFYVRLGNTNTTKADTVLSFSSDTAGNFSFRIEEGNYSIIQSMQLNELNLAEYTNRQFMRVDTNCLKNWWVKPYSLLEVKDKDVRDLNFTFRHKCFVSADVPCMTYIGPMPP